MQLMQRWNTLVGSMHRVRSNRGNQLPVVQERRMNRHLNARKGTRVLIIDDSERSLSELGKVFAALDYVTLKSSEPQRGLSKACFENPDLVILDIGMPGMNGFEVLRRIRRDPLARRVPVILISGNPKAIEMYHQLRVDADGFIEKPISRYAIFSTIEKLLDQDGIPRRLINKRSRFDFSFLKRISGSLASRKSEQLHTLRGPE
jgi:twitching motility two-component system response regulator PilH